MSIKPIAQESAAPPHHGVKRTRENTDPDSGGLASVKSSLQKAPQERTVFGEMTSFSNNVQVKDQDSEPPLAKRPKVDIQDNKEPADDGDADMDDFSAEAFSAEIPGLPYQAILQEPSPPQPSAQDGPLIPVSPIDPRYLSKLAGRESSAPGNEPRVEDIGSREIRLRAATNAMQATGLYNTPIPQGDFTHYQVNLQNVLFGDLFSLANRIKPLKLPKVQRERFERLLNAPDYHHNFYLNTLSWGLKHVAIAENDTVRIYDYNKNATVADLVYTNRVTAVAWNPNLASRIAIAIQGKGILYYDVDKKMKQGFVELSDKTVYAIDWRNSQEFSYGCENAIGHYDHRTKKTEWFPGMDKIGRVASLKWSGSEHRLAIGCQMKAVHVYDLTNREFLTSFRHKSHVKALGWQPGASNHHLLSGGGKLDKCLIFADTAAKKTMNTLETHAEICDLAWLSKDICAVGFGLGSAGEKGSETTNNLHLYFFNEQQKRFHLIGNMQGQMGRIMNISKDPSSMRFCTASSKGTLAFWNPFSEAPKEKEKPAATPGLSLI